MATPSLPIQAPPETEQQNQQTQQAPPVDPTNLPDTLWKPLWDLLVNDLETADEIPRRYEVREILKRRLFFRGEQYWWCDSNTGQWYPPSVPPTGINPNDYEQPAFQHVTNIIQSTLLGLCSVLSQNNANSRFWPSKASDPGDVQMAKNASKAADYIHRNNDWSNRVDECTYFMGTDGFFGSYSRYVSDAEKFGTDDQTIVEARQVPLGDPFVGCPSCGLMAEGTTETQPTCPDCGEPLQDHPPEMATVPHPVGTLSIPKGQEVVTIVPALQLKRTMWADDQQDFMYMDWITDLHKAKAIQTYTDKETQLNTSGGSETDGGSANTYERIARRLLYLGTGRHTGMTLKDLGTFRRAWIRPAALYNIGGHSENEATPCTRCQLLQLFPKGVHIVFFNDVYCESRNESMDEKWETMHTMPGEGQLRETLISSIMPIQEQLNDAINLLFEIMMYGVPEGFADCDVIDFEARSQQTASAGNITPTKSGLGPAGDIRAKMSFIPAVEPSVAMMKYIDMLLNEIPQMLSGYFPALFGGDTGGNDTAAGISIQRNQALGRIGRAWRRLQIFFANTDAKAVRCFAKNRTEDVELPQSNPAGDYDSDFIRLDDMKGNITAYPEVDAQYPTLQSDIRALITNLYNNAASNPLTLQTISVPENLEYVFRQMGANDLEVPGEQQRIKTYKDIQQLIQEEPQQTPAVPPRPPSPQEPQGFQGQEPQFLPSVKPDPDVDDLKVASETAQKWLISDKGMELKQSQPMAYENVKAYKKACDQLGLAKQFKQLVAAQGMQGQGPAADLGGAEDIQPPQPAQPKDSQNPPQEQEQ